ncbi:MAG: DUF362 domain-containing protein [Candidatus Eisenbacteria bacterium]|nr:DUF362 domain-containing protein [Candidatus Eisenbacteria bacterium]
MNALWNVSRRRFLQAAGAVGAGLVLGNPLAWAEGKKEADGRTRTNVDDALAVPRTDHSLPGPFPGRVVEVHDPAAMPGGSPDPATVEAMFGRGIQALTRRNLRDSFHLFFDRTDTVGIKVNPVGAGLISTRLELVDAIIAWLVAHGIRRNKIVIWDRFDSMLAEAGFTPKRYPGIRIEGLQTMDEAAFTGEAKDDSGWLNADGLHVSARRFDPDVYYWADVEGPEDKNYLNQHVFNGRKSPFGRLVTRDLTKIINVPVFKNTGNGVSMATKNLGYGAICNTGRLHQPLFFDVCTEVLAFPAIRDKLVLNVMDGLRGQYDGGPMPVADKAFVHNRIYLATDPFAMDRVGHDQMVAKRKEMGVRVNEHPKYSEYLHYAERLGLGVADPSRIEHVVV